MENQKEKLYMMKLPSRNAYCDKFNYALKYFLINSSALSCIERQKNIKGHKIS